MICHFKLVNNLSQNTHHGDVGFDEKEIAHNIRYLYTNTSLLAIIFTSFQLIPISRSPF